MKQYFENNQTSQIIHATKSLVLLRAILQEQQFKMNYCKEEFCIANREISKRVHPMVCFTEQSSKYLSDTVITYGRYGIALSSTWVVRNNIQPVIYMDQGSHVARSMEKLLLHRRKLARGNSLRQPIMTIACFTKNAVGYNSGLKQHDFVFKNENEWRYVPTKADIGNGYISESRKVYENNTQKYKEHLANFHLKFDIMKDVVAIYCDTMQECNTLEMEFPSLIGKVSVAQWKTK